MKITSAISCLIILCFVTSIIVNAKHRKTEFTITHVDSFPAIILHFSAKKYFERIILNWSTSAEVDSRYFAVERSSNGTTWVTCARMDAAGTTDTYSEYETNDYTPTPTQSLYRLKLVDWKGAATFSNVVTVEFEPGVSLDIYPNPATDFINIELTNMPEGPSVLIISDITGKAIRKINAQNNFIKIQLKGFKTGIYFLRIVKNGKIYSEKFIMN